MLFVANSVNNFYQTKKSGIAAALFVKYYVSGIIYELPCQPPAYE